MSEGFQQDDREFIARAKDVLDRTAEEIDPVTGWRLQRARLSALEGRAVHKRWLVWVSGAALASVAAIALTLWVRQPTPERHTAVPLEDFELVTSIENVELAEDLDFYHWLADDDSKG
jgi:hypothetical protein